MRPFAQVDVFTDRLGLGNPVAVVLAAEGLTDDEMRSFARWTNLSETTFVMPPTDPAADYRVRIFTPAEELPFAGHPTIGSCHAWLEGGGKPAHPDRIVQQCSVGLVTLRRTDGRLSFATPPLIRSGSPTAEELALAIAELGLEASEVVDSAWIDNGPGWLGIRIASVERLAALTPEIAVSTPAKYGVVAVPGPESDAGLHVRAFFNAGGTREDPTTGSLNGSVAQWLLGDGTMRAPYVSSQGTAMRRDGRVYIDQADGEIWVGGHAVTGITGSVAL